MSIIFLIFASAFFQMELSQKKIIMFADDTKSYVGSETNDSVVRAPSLWWFIEIGKTGFVASASFSFCFIFI